MPYRYNFKLEEQFGRAVNVLVGPNPLRDRLRIARYELGMLRPGGHLLAADAPSPGFAERFNTLMATLGNVSSWRGKSIRDGHRQRSKQIEIASTIISLFEDLCRASGDH